jgi:hypothetical protein
MFRGVVWSGRRDLNSRPPDPQSGGGGANPLIYKVIFRGDARWTPCGPKREAYYRGLTPCCDDAPSRGIAATSPPRSVSRSCASWAAMSARTSAIIAGAASQIRQADGGGAIPRIDLRVLLKQLGKESRIRLPRQIWIRSMRRGNQAPRRAHVRHGMSSSLSAPGRPAAAGFRPVASRTNERRKLEEEVGGSVVAKGSQQRATPGEFDKIGLRRAS